MARIRYTKGPDELTFGNLQLTRDEWADAPEDLACQALRKPRADEYGFEAEGLPAAEPESTPEDSSDTRKKR